MSRFRRLNVLQAMVDTGLVPVFYHESLEVSKAVASALAAGGCKFMEFTNRGEGAWQVFSGLQAYCAKEHPSMMVGVGSVVDPETAGMFINSGAAFVVGPNFNPAVARLCNRRGVAYSPGCGSASEISDAQEAGCEILKVFPARCAGGPEFVKSIAGPMPWTQIMVTGGVKAERNSILDWFRAGIVAAGIGSELITKELLASADYDSLSAKTAQVLAWIREARNTPIFLGVEHIGLHLDEQQVASDTLARWFADTFGFKMDVGNSSIFLSGGGPGRIEVMKQPAALPGYHLAIAVSDFDLAVADLIAKGIELEEPIVKPGLKAVFFKKPAPNGQRIHILWRQ